MGHACPVCGAPQADGAHLANHLAFAAMLHGGDHEAWLAEHVPDWAKRDPDGLAADVVGLAPEREHETVSEGARDDGRESAHGPDELDELDPETRRAVPEARELARGGRSDPSGEE